MILAQDERLVEFSFSSRIESDVSPESMLRLARQSWSANRRAGVSGFLRLDGVAIEQIVEGPCTQVLCLASRILTDRRHCEIVIRRFGPIGVRRFADWRLLGFEALAPAPADARRSRAGLRLLADAGHAPGDEGSPALARVGAT